MFPVHPGSIARFCQQAPKSIIKFDPPNGVRALSPEP